MGPAAWAAWALAAGLGLAGVLSTFVVLLWRREERAWRDFIKWSANRYRLPWED